MTPIRTRLNRLRLVCLIVMGASALGAARDEAAPEKIRRYPLDQAADLRHIQLELDLDLEQREVTAVATLQLAARRQLSSIRFNAVDFDVSQVTASSPEGSARPARFVNDGEELEVTFDAPLQAGEETTVTVHYRLKDPRSGLHFFGPNADEPDAPRQVWSQGQTLDNRYWIPCFDHPNEMQTSEIIATVKEGLQVLSNGKLVSRKPGPRPGTQTWHWRQEAPHVAYLITLVVGQFEVQTDEWRGKPVSYYVPPGRRDDIQRSFGDTLRMLELFSERIGVEYPWDQYAQVCCYRYGGGMENTSATTLGERTLHDADAALDFSSEGLVAHELAHQWYGDLLTCTEWAHTWLNEGFATFFELVWTKHDLGSDEAAYELYEKMRDGLPNGEKRPILDRGYSDPDEMFGARSYEKAAVVLHMLEAQLGEEVFWKAVNEYTRTYRHQNVESSDLRRVLERVSGRSLGRFFYDWIEMPGHPVIEAESSWDAEQGIVTVALQQTQEREPFHLPITVAFHLPGGEVRTVTRDMRDRSLEVTLALPQRPEMVRIDPENALVEVLREDKPRDWMIQQLRHDPNVAGRIYSAEQLARKKTDATRAVLAEALAAEPFWGVRVEIARLLGDMGGVVARDALVAGLKADDARVRRACAAALDNFYGDESVIVALRELVQGRDRNPRAMEAALRSLGRIGRGGLMDTLKSALDVNSHRERVRIAAIEAIARQPEPEAIDALIQWCARGKPGLCRTAALRALAGAARRHWDDLGPAQRQSVFSSLFAALDGEDEPLRESAARALGDLGESDPMALEKLDALAKLDRPEGLRKAASEAAKRIRADEPLKAEVAELREQLDELKDSFRKLEQRTASEAR